MTNKEAIEILKEGAPFSEIYNKDYEEALNLAIKALEEQPTGEWERDDEHSITFDIFKCSHCGGWGATHFRFCPKCGAKIKEGEEK